MASRDGCVVGIDAGATNTRVVIRDPDNRVVTRGDYRTTGDDFEQWLAKLHDSLGAGCGFGYRIQSVGLAIAGNVDYDGKMVGSGNLPDFKSRNVRERVSSVFGHVPTAVLNDCAASAMGEFSRLQVPLTYATWSSGIGVGHVSLVNGQPVAEATELGHMYLPSDSDAPCGCSPAAYNHWEAFCGGKNLARRFNGVDPEYASNDMFLPVFDDMALGLRALSAAKPDGRPIVIGGTITRMRDPRCEQMQERVNTLGMSCEPPQLLPSAIGDDNGLEGAVYAARQLPVV